MKIIFTLLACCFLSLSCSSYHDKVKPRSLTPDQMKKLLESPEKISYNVLMQNVIGPYCAKCHNPFRKEGNVDLTTFQALYGKKSKPVLIPYLPLESSLFTTLTAKGDLKMPPVKERQLQPIHEQLVYQWIQNGAQENGGKVANRKIISDVEKELARYYESPETIDFKVVNKYVLSVNCNDCHSRNGSKPNRDAIQYSADTTSYNSLMNGFTKSIDKGFPEESSLFSSVAMAQTMPPIEHGYRLMNPYRVKLLRLWILNCAIEDYSQIKGNDNLLTTSQILDKVRLCDGQ